MYRWRCKTYLFIKSYIFFYFESVIDRYSNWFVLAQRPIAISIVEPDVYELPSDSSDCEYTLGGYGARSAE